MQNNKIKTLTMKNGKIIYPKVPSGLSQNFKKFLRRVILRSLLGMDFPEMGPGLKKFVEESIQSRNRDDIRAWLQSHRSYPYLKDWMMQKLKEPDQSWRKYYL